MKVRVLSVPHTGTRFTMEALRGAGFNVRFEPTTTVFLGTQITKNSVPDEECDWFEAAHFDGNTRNRLFAERCPAVIPLRQKDEVRASWKRRNKKMEEFEASWRQMEEFVSANPNVHFLRIDDPENRDGDLNAISELVGRPLHADFSIKVGQGT